MKHLIVALILALALTTGACAADNLKQISSGGITVSYPDGLDMQAKKVLAIAHSEIGPALEVHRQTIALLADPDAMAADISKMLGAEEKKDMAKTRLASFKNKSTVLVAAFSNIRLVRKANVIAANGIDGGAMQLRYSKEKDEFNLAFDDQDASPDKLKRSFFPVIVNPDGTIRSEAKLGQIALDFLGSASTLAIAPVQDTVSYLIADSLKIYHPLTRWFNEGVSGYVTRQIIAKYAPKLNSMVNSMFAVSAQSEKLRDKVNLWSWPQSAYMSKDPGVFDARLETARTQFAIEAVSNMLAKAAPDALPKIMNILNYSGNPDSDAICAAIQKVTGTDFKPTLMSYVPDDIRKGIASGGAAKLIAKAEEQVKAKKWQDAAASLRQALEMTPDDVNARLNLAWIEREFGERKDSELQVFLVAGLCKQQKYSFHLYESAIEGNYVSGRLAILMGNLEAAKQFLAPVLQYKPDHADAKRAMDDVRKLEEAAKERSDTDYAITKSTNTKYELGREAWAMNDGAVQRKSFKFALDVIKVYSKLVEEKEYVLSKQLLRSGTSIGANVQEAIAGESRKDFISKMSIARKEARETRYWLCLLRESDLTAMNMAKELAAVDELLRILTAILKSTKGNPRPRTIHSSRFAMAYLVFRNS